MNKSGHKGISILFTSPVFALLLTLDLFILGGIFAFISIYLSSFPDIDVKLKNFDSIRIFNFQFHGLTSIQIFNIPKRYIFHMLLIKVTLFFRNLHVLLLRNNSERISHSEFSVSHRGITHTVWYMISVGLLLGILSFSLLFPASLLLPIEYAELLFIDFLQASVYTTSFIFFAAGFCGILFHCIGDVFTPTGINFISLETNYGLSLRQLSFTILGKTIEPEFYYDNEVANRSAGVFGIIGFIYAIIFGLYYGQVNPIYLIGGFIGLFLLGIPVWLLIVKTRIGDMIYKIYDIIA